MSYAELNDGRLYVQTDESLAHVACAKFSKKQGAWVLPGSEAALNNLLEALPMVELNEEAQDMLAEYEQKRARLAKVLAGAVLPYPRTKTKPWRHQEQAYWLSVISRSFGLFMDMGTGKSKVAVDLVETQELLCTLVVCPKSVVPVWDAQFTIHGDGKTLVVPLTRGTSKQKAAVIKAAMAQRAARVVFVINYESVWREDVAAEFDKLRLDCIICDEAHKLKGVSTKASVYLAQRGLSVPHRYALTGTPFPENPLQVYGIARFIDPTVFGTSYSRFDTRFGEYVQIGQFRKFSKMKDEAAFQRKMEDIGIVVDKSVISLPKLLQIPVPVDLPPDARETYDTIRDDALVVCDNITTPIAHKLTQMMRLQQMAGGFITRSDGQAAQQHTAKLDALRDIVDGLPADEPMVVFSVYKAEIAHVCAMLESMGRKVGRVDGTRSDYVAWQQGKLQDLVVQIRSGGAGIDLSRASHSAYYSTGFSLTDFEQSLARLHRPGQTKDVKVFHLIARNTIDRYVYKALQTKKDVVAECLSGLKQL